MDLKNRSERPCCHYPRDTVTGRAVVSAISGSRLLCFLEEAEGTGFPTTTRASESARTMPADPLLRIALLAPRSKRFDVALPPGGGVQPRDEVRGDLASLGYRARAQHEFRSVRVPRERRVEYQLVHDRARKGSPQQTVLRHRVGIRRILGKGRRMQAFGVEASAASVLEEREQSAVDPVHRMHVSPSRDRQPLSVAGHEVPDRIDGAIVRILSLALDNLRSQRGNRHSVNRLLQHQVGVLRYLHATHQTAALGDGEVLGAHVGSFGVESDGFVQRYLLSVVVVHVVGAAVRLRISKAVNDLRVPRGIAVGLHGRTVEVIEEASHFAGLQLFVSDQADRTLLDLEIELRFVHLPPRSRRIVLEGGVKRPDAVESRSAFLVVHHRREPLVFQPRFVPGTLVVEVSGIRLGDITDVQRFTDLRQQNSVVRKRIVQRIHERPIAVKSFDEIDGVLRIQGIEDDDVELFFRSVQLVSLQPGLVGKPVPEPLERVEVVHLDAGIVHAIPRAALEHRAIVPLGQVLLRNLDDNGVDLHHDDGFDRVVLQGFPKGRALASPHDANPLRARMREHGGVH
mmetsp:Transcript_20215/g.47482  ORF Transcript_20215/g.47482 Transcript_20215/m.47482 type:complete len:571 (-) Transcript_20215:1567-3279(-)